MSAKQNNINPKNLPYRPSVGMMIVNQKHNKIFVGKRIDTKQPAWQMPQGGIDLGETPSKAVLREMKEEIGTNNGRIMAESKEWYSYDVPKNIIPRLWGGSFRGQRQKWFLIEFLGNDSEINIATENPEFIEWCWMPKQDLLNSIISFKSKLYQAVIEEFKNLLPD